MFAIAGFEALDGQVFYWTTGAGWLFKAFEAGAAANTFRWRRGRDG